jgi:hypothetical protein
MVATNVGTTCFGASPVQPYKPLPAVLMEVDQKSENIVSFCIPLYLSLISIAESL